MGRSAQCSTSVGEQGMDNNSPAPDWKPVFRLQGLGIKEPWQAALLLPTHFDDPKDALANHRLAEMDIPYLMRVQVASPARAYFNGAPRCVVSLNDEAGESFQATVFGDTKIWQEVLRNGEWITLILRFNVHRERVGAVIVDRPDPRWHAQLRPVYPGIPTVIKADEVRDIVQSLLPWTVPWAAREVTKRLVDLGHISELLAELEAEGWTMAQVIEQCHRPLNRAYAEFATECMLKIAALDALRGTIPTEATVVGSPVRFETTALRARSTGLNLTGDQRAAIQGLLATMAEGRRLKAALIGDTGSGKSAVFLTVAAAFVDATRGNVAILLPTGPLASQMYKDACAWFADLKIALVTGDTQFIAPDAQILIGTTALLCRDIGPVGFLVVDEEQKFSVADKEQLMDQSTHQLVVSATCIPRTQALSRYGVLQVHELREGHANRFITTRIMESEQRNELFAEVRAAVRQGEQVLVVYPVRGEDQESGKHTVEGAAKSWAKTFGAERIRTLTGADTEEHKIRVIEDMQNGAADIILSTTVIEVGITIRKLRLAIVIEPDRFGLATLHQIRGRLARHGGEGQFVLFLTGPISESTRERLSVLVRFANGFDVAARDLELRGYGDLKRDSTRQSGATESLIFGQACPIAFTDAVYPLFCRRAQKLQPGRNPPTNT